MHRTRDWRILSVAAVVLLLGCGGSTRDAGENAGKGASGTPLEITPAARIEANEVFKTICVTCHGENGHGDGPGAAATDPKPRDFADVKWQESVTDEHIIKVITLGGAAVGKSPQMTAQPQLKGKTLVLRALVNRIRRFKGRKD
ncbi:MAG: hypothetical protein H6832_08180 [Planctomycetes bacterium]|nr:hypothetical protein [Planctomycetota bacterium]